MGSILSFPILCLANLGLYLWVIEEDERPLSEKLKGVLVNGDDMLYRAPHSLWDRHVELGNRVGLEMTPGKAYSHERFAGVNSQCFDVAYQREVETPYRVNFLNSGLYRMQKKVMRTATVDGEDAKEATPLAVFSAFVQGAKNERKQVDLAKLFIAKHGRDMNREAGGRNWFIHQSLGGCGATAPHGFKWDANGRQRRLACLMLFGAHPHATAFEQVGPRRELQARLLERSRSTEVTPPWGEEVTEVEKTRVNWRLIRRLPLTARHTHRQLAAGWSWSA
jgi:hypothetical protein